jgi:putative ABC transport system permease protein
MWQDVRFAFRMLAKSPGFTAIAVLTLALGIGANTAIFSAVNGIILKPLPYADSSRLVSISGYKRWKVAGDRQVVGTVSLPFDVWRKVQSQTPSIEQMALYGSEDFTITGDAAPEIISGAYVSSDFFPLLGVQPLAGRPILPGDTQPGAKPVVVVSYVLWRERWGGDAGAIGRTVILDQKSYRLIGVMPPGFDFGLHSPAKGIWVAYVDLPAQKTDDAPKSFAVVARLKKDVTVEAANAQLKTISPRFSNDFGVFGKAGNFEAHGLGRKFGSLDNALLILLGAVGFVLLIACVNVSGLLLARGWARRREVAIREA